MNKDLFEKFKALDLPLGKYAIFGSGPMGVRGLRKCTDIDFVVTDELFEWLKNQSQWKEGTSCLGSKMLSYREDGTDIEALREWLPGIWNIKELVESAEIIDGLAFAGLKEVLRWKKMRNKEKDKKDIEIIEEYLKGEQK